MPNKKHCFLGKLNYVAAFQRETIYISKCLPQDNLYFHCKSIANGNTIYMLIY